MRTESILKCLAFLPGLGMMAGSCGKPGGEKPNFLILISDDQRWDQLSCADHPIIPELKTPNLDRLAQQGSYFKNAFVTSPVCAVSRASIMTGRYASSHGMNHFNTPIDPGALAKTYPALLRGNGYLTAILGKWGIGVEGTERVFDVFNAWPDQGRYFHDTDTGRIHNTEWLAAKTRNFLESVDPAVPFCLTVCFKSPHHPYQPDERDKYLFEDAIIPSRATDSEEAYSRLPAHVMDSSLNRWCYFDERRDQKTKDDFEKNFLRCVASLDRGVGEIMSHLEDLNLDENTVVIFLSDNGYLWGEHGLGGKWVLYEESIRVPIIIRDPRLPRRKQGRRLDQMALNTDIAPTILDLAGIPIPAEMDGVSLVPVLRNPSASTRTDFFMEHVDVIKVENPIPDSRGVRTEEWKYIRYLNVTPEAEELYHLKTDPLESQNLIHNPEYLSIANQIRTTYSNYLDQFQER